MKGKIIQLHQKEAVIGYEDGSFKSVKYEDLGFRPVMGDEIESYSQADKVVYVQNPRGQIYHDKGGKKAVNKIVYILLAILLGDIGAHKFYQGKIIMGIIYILFCWTYVPGILGLIEGLLAISKKSDAEGNILI